MQNISESFFGFTASKGFCPKKSKTAAENCSHSLILPLHSGILTVNAQCHKEILLLKSCFYPFSVNFAHRTYMAVVRFTFFQRKSAFFSNSVFPFKTKTDMRSPDVPPP